MKLRCATGSARFSRLSRLAHREVARQSRDSRGAALALGAAPRQPVRTRASLRDTCSVGARGVEHESCDFAIGSVMQFRKSACVRQADIGESDATCANGEWTMAVKVTLERRPRSTWWRRAVRRPRSISAHSGVESGTPSRTRTKDGCLGSFLPRSLHGSVASLIDTADPCHGASGATGVNGSRMPGTRATPSNCRRYTGATTNVRGSMRTSRCTRSRCPVVSGTR